MDYDSVSTFAETWGRGLIAPDPSVLVRGAKKPGDLVYRARD